jgi:hypothetical protein
VIQFLCPLRFMDGLFVPSHIGQVDRIPVVRFGVLGFSSIAA